MTTTRRLRCGRVAAAIGLAVAGAAIVPQALLDVPQSPVAQVPVSTLVLDRRGRLLRAFPVAEGRWRLPVKAGQLDPLYLRMLLAFEDKRFHRHGGVDYLALARAAVQFVRHAEIVSGGSTLTMQLVRLLDGRQTRSFSGKLRQMRQAIALERVVGKESILDAYLTLAPFGGNIEGVRAASLVWFGQEPRRLTPAQAALLVALPQSPEARRPDRDPDAARRARDRVLARATAAGVLDQNDADKARGESIPTDRLPFPMLAAHAAQRAVRDRPDLRVLRLTFDADIQKRLERLAAVRASALGDRVSVAMLVADLRNGEVRASVGSAGLFDEDRDGYVDMTRALRSPGSTLKPLIYGLAFEAGIGHPESLIEDRPTGFRGYVPANFDRGFQGTVTLRRALQLSLNVPAVRLLDRVGPARLMARLRRAGVRPELAGFSPPGLAVGLGGIGLRLSDLVAVFGAIARGGRPLVLTETLVAPSQTSQPRGVKPRVLDEVAAWYVASVLSGAHPGTVASVKGIALKTGTSYGYRDAWAIGFDGRHVAGVWAGRPDGAPVPGLTGVDAAAPLLIDLFARLGSREPLPGPPPGALMAGTGDLPLPLRRVGGPRLDGEATRAPEIAFPPAGARVLVPPDQGGGLVLRVRDGRPPFTWFANELPVAREPHARTARWRPDGRGFSTISVVDGLGRSSRVQVFLDSDS